MQRPEPFQWEHDAYNNNYEDCGLTGYTGLDYHTVAQLSVMPAWRAQIGRRGYYKAGLAVMPDDTLIASPVDMLAPKVKVPYPAGVWGKESWPVRLHKSTDGGHAAGWATTRQLADGTLVTIYALEPYHIEPKENGRNVCHTVRWCLPRP